MLHFAPRQDNPAVRQYRPVLRTGQRSCPGLVVGGGLGWHDVQCADEKSNVDITNGRENPSALCKHSASSDDTELGSGVGEAGCGKRRSSW